MRLCYLIQTHKNPAQVERLVSTLKAASSDCFILVMHDFSGCEFPAERLQPYADLALIAKQAEGIRGDFSLVQAYLDAVAWLLQNQIQFDWLINLSGQDYPIRPLHQLEAQLVTCQTDGLFEYFDVFSADSPWGIAEGQERYLYQYWQAGFELNQLQRAVLKPLKIWVNAAQPWFRMNLAYGLNIGIKAADPPFSADFRCYGGSFFKILSNRAVCYLHQFQQHELIRYYHQTRQPDESFIQTVLLNMPQFTFSNQSWIYVDFSQTQSGHPRTLTASDYPKLIQSDAYFARKFDLQAGKPNQLLDQLDYHIFDAKPVI